MGDGYLDELYVRISEIAKQDIYSFMKSNNQSSLNYQFTSYFQHYVDTHNIKLLGHHFSNRKIEGLTIIDKEGISFSYERENSKEKQNFTKCHELGHFILGHSGKFFTELRGIQDRLVEREANIFSSIILMPDIVLLSKIFYRKDDFQRVIEDLSVSREALIFRLVGMFLHFLFEEEIEIFKVVDEYCQGCNQKILDYFQQVKKYIINDYQKVKRNIFE